MRSIKNQITIIMIGIIVLVTMIFMSTFYLQLESIVRKETEAEASRDITTAETIIDLKYPGAWHAMGNTLYKGEAEINNDFDLVDSIKEVTGNSCSIYLNGICVATTLLQSDCNIRAVGKPVPREVESNVLEAGHYYLGQADIEGKSNQVAYTPIISDQGRAIGVVYIGTAETLYNSIIYSSLKTMGIVGLIITLLLGLLTRTFADRSLIKPLQELIERTQKTLHRGDKPSQISSGNEFKELFQAIDQLLAEVQEEPGGWQNKDNQLPIDASQDVPPAVEQNDFELLDAYFNGQQEVPKGLNPITLKEIVAFLQEEEVSEITAKDLSKIISLSEVTVRRYLDFLGECGFVEIEQQYGSVGRPLRIYKFKK
ncbi:MAG TPA: hypothetical protein DDW83_03115 [Peptococcaceae bacterium]|nr:hypothetical protein [Peptococcaceae bacterium]